MPRTRRQWSALRADVRTLLRETTAATSFWDDPLLLQLFNQSMDMRVMELAEQHEGWVTETWDTNIVSGQGVYTLPEGTGRPKRIAIRLTDGPTTVEHTLTRAERWSGTLTTGTSAVGGARGYQPTYRLVGNFIKLEPAPNYSETDGLAIDFEYAPDRLVNDTDELDPSFPDVMESLLIYDTVVLAYELEDAQGQGAPAGLMRARQEFAARFFDYTALRSQGRTFGTPWQQGD